jgi:hypothetical protein
MMRDWLLAPRVDALVGHQPWLSYRNMLKDMQRVFRQIPAARGLWHGRDTATHQDLSALFVACAAELDHDVARDPETLVKLVEAVTPTKASCTHRPSVARDQDCWTMVSTS